MGDFFTPGSTTTSGSTSSSASPYAQWGLDAAKGATQQAMGSGVAPLNDWHQAGIRRIDAIADQPNQAAAAYGNIGGFVGQGGYSAPLQQAMGYLQPMAAGGTAGQNPALQAMMQRNAEMIGGQANRMARQVGASGNSPETQAFLAKSIAQANNPLISQAYESDMNRQLQAGGLLGSLAGAADQRMIGAANLLPTLGEARYSDAQKFMGIGDAYRGATQSQLDNPLARLGTFSDILRGNQAAMPTSTTSVQAGQTPSTASMVGQGLGILGAFL